MDLPKFRSIVLRIFFSFAYFPIRLLRFVFHLLYPFLFWVKGVSQYQIIKSWLDWFCMIPFYLIDLLGISDIYEIVNELINWNIRDINAHEKYMIREIFANDIPINHIRINPANLIAKRLRIAYVSFRQINFNSSIPNDIFVHEVVHIWQYQIFGAVYIYFAWKAQMSKEGYHYGKAPALVKSLREGKLFHEFNFEQQAEIIQDMYRFSNFASHTSVNEDERFAYKSYQSEMNNLT